ncbi:uncharacterized protein LOC111102704 [Crassostrea virginica]
MRFLVVILVVWAEICWESHASLSIHSNNLVQMFSDYLASLEQRQMDIHNRKRDVDSETPEQLRICTGRKDCGSVVQNFGFMYDQESSMDMCNTSYVTKADGITCFDKYPSCKYLREQFSVCEKPEVASKLGCDLTCGKCKAAPKFETNTRVNILY